jgi:hypothetical protein
MSHSIRCKLKHNSYAVSEAAHSHATFTCKDYRHAYLATFGITLLACTLSITASFAEGNANAGKAAWSRTCERCHGNPMPRSKNAFSDYGTTANRLSIYANDPVAITKAANEGYIVPEGNTNDKVPVGKNTREEMGAFAGMAPDRLGYGTTPTQYAIDISAYFASLFEAPSTPSITSVKSGTGHATVSFTEAKSELPITSYTVTANPGELQSNGMASPIIINNLANGTEYTFSVIATNNAGSSKPSAPSKAAIPPSPIATSATPAPVKVTPAEPPKIIPAVPPAPAISVPAAAVSAAAHASQPTFDQNSPTILRARAGDRQAKIYFNVPVAVASTITDFTVIAVSKGVATGISAKGTKSPITVSGLNNGSDYTFTVTANYNDGKSLRSAPSDQITPLAILAD